MEVAIGTRIYITGDGFDPGLYQWDGVEWTFIDPRDWGE